MKKLLLLAGILVMFWGCAAIQQGRADYKSGKDTPYQEGEKTPAQLAQEYGNIVSAIPVVGNFTPQIIIGLTGFLTWMRGRKIRKGLPTNTEPFSGKVGEAIGLEAIVQHGSNLLTGAFDVGAEDSPFRRAWKIFLSTALGLIGLGATVPSFHNFILNHPAVGLALAGISSLLGGLDKYLSTVEPLEKKVV